MINGTTGNDSLTGTTGDDEIFGFEGDDTLEGLAGVDFLNGGPGMDRLVGGDDGDEYFTSGTFNDNTLSEFDGDTIVGFDPLNATDPVDPAGHDLLSFFGGFLFYDNPTVADVDGDVVMTITDEDDTVTASIILEDVPSDATFRTFTNRLGTIEVYRVIDGIITATYPESVFELVNRDFIGDIDLTIPNGVEIGRDPTGTFPTAFSRLHLNGEQIIVRNEGQLAQNFLNGTDVQFTNANRIDALPGQGSIVSLGGFGETGTNTVAFTNELGAVLTGTTAFNVFTGEGDVDTATLTNDGTIEAWFALVQGSGADNLVVENTGTMRMVDLPTDFFFGASIGIGGAATPLAGGTASVTNSGTIEVLTDIGGVVTGQSTAVILDDRETASLVNDGQIRSVGDAVLYQYRTDTGGVGTLTIDNNGLLAGDVDSTGGGVAVRGFNLEAILPGSDVQQSARFDIDNSGTIQGDLDLFQESAFILTGFIGFGPSGAILSVADAPLTDQSTDADGGLLFDDNGQPVFPSSVTSPTLGELFITVPAEGNTVEIRDADGDQIFLLPDAGVLPTNAFDDVVVNTGTVDGRVMLGLGEDSFDGSSATTYQFVDGGIGNDSIAGGLFEDELYGADGDDTLDGGDLDDFIEGGLGSDLLFGSAGDDVIFGDLDDTMV